jgi:hypothetical protein
MKEKVKVVPKVSIRRDPRFTLEENWAIVEENILECQQRGVLVTPLTVFDDGNLVGWYLHGWQSAPGKIIYEAEPFEEDISDYCI